MFNRIAQWKHQSLHRLRPPPPPPWYGDHRVALAEKYPTGTTVLGAKLGYFVKSQLHQDLRTAFGGLRRFLGNYFPSEIQWAGRQGLDDLYLVSFGQVANGASVWRPVSYEGTSSLWAAVTNPSVDILFAWDADRGSLLEAPTGTDLADGLQPVPKISKADYRTIALSFMDTLGQLDPAMQAQGTESAGSSFEFTSFIRQHNLLSRWEEFRVDRVVSMFADRLVSAGASEPQAQHYVSLLRAAHQEARLRRSKKSVSSPAPRTSQRANVTHSTGKVREAKALARTALEFMSDSELNVLCIPLGAIMRALDTLSQTI